MPTPQKLFVQTYGCQMNVYDSKKMEELLLPHGFENTNTYLDANMVILNTCHVREKAAEKVYSELGKIRLAKEAKKQKGERMVIVVAGCTAQAEGDEIIRRAPYVDIVVGPQSYHNLPELLEKVKRDNTWAIDLDFTEDDKFDRLPQEGASTQGICAFLSIQEGCDKFCTFCIVPYTRGAEYSRSVSAIYREAVALVKNGAKEITLLGQNVSAYHGEGANDEIWSLGKLIKHLSKIKGLERIRYMTSHPGDMIDEELFEAHANESKLAPFLHLPVQSGSDKILKSMNRKHTAEDYLRLIEKFRKARPDMAFSSDFIVGFPGETDEDFQKTLELIHKVKFSQCYFFKYSSRPGTPASVMGDQVSEEVKDARIWELQALVRSQQTEFNNAHHGKILNVLFDKLGTKPGQIQGKSEYNQAVCVQADADRYIGTIQKVLVTKVLTNSLLGELQ